MSDCKLNKIFTSLAEQETGIRKQVAKEPVCDTNKEDGKAFKAHQGLVRDPTAPVTKDRQAEKCRVLGTLQDDRS